MSVVTTGASALTAAGDAASAGSPRSGSTPDRVVFLYRLTSGAGAYPRKASVQPPP